MKNSVRRCLVPRPNNPRGLGVWSHVSVSDTPPKVKIDREGLKRRRTGTGKGLTFQALFSDLRQILAAFMFENVNAFIRFEVALNLCDSAPLIHVHFVWRVILCACFYRSFYNR